MSGTRQTAPPSHDRLSRVGVTANSRAPPAGTQEPFFFEPSITTPPISPTRRDASPALNQIDAIARRLLNHRHGRALTRVEPNARLHRPPNEPGVLSSHLAPAH